MSEFKFLNVVYDDTEGSKIASKPLYEVLDWNINRSGKSLIKPLHGATPEMAAQKFLFDHSRDFLVYVRKELPEHKFEKFEATSYSRNPAIQSLLWKEVEETEDPE